MNYIVLLVAIVAEVIGTSFLKKADGFREFTPTMCALASYFVALLCLSIAMRTIPVGVTYAIWCGIGIVLISIISFFVFKQVLDAPAIIGITLIMAGVLAIKLFSKSVA